MTTMSYDPQTKTLKIVSSNVWHIECAAKKNQGKGTFYKREYPFFVFRRAGEGNVDLSFQAFPADGYYCEISDFVNNELVYVANIEFTTVPPPPPPTPAKSVDLSSLLIFGAIAIGLIRLIGGRRG